MSLSSWVVAGEWVSFFFLLWCIINYDKFVAKWRSLKERKARRQTDEGDRYVEEINRLTRVDKDG